MLFMEPSLGNDFSARMKSHERKVKCVGCLSVIFYIGCFISALLVFILFVWMFVMGCIYVEKHGIKNISDRIYYGAEQEK